MVPESGNEDIVTCGVRGRVSMVPESAYQAIVTCGVPGRVAAPMVPEFANEDIISLFLVLTIDWFLAV